MSCHSLKDGIPCKPEECYECNLEEETIMNNQKFQAYVDRLEHQYYMSYPKAWNYRNGELDPFWEWVNLRDFDLEDAFKRNLNPADIFGGHHD